jgi:hypothetical protein
MFGAEGDIFLQKVGKVYGVVGEALNELAKVADETEQRAYAGLGSGGGHFRDCSNLVGVWMETFSVNVVAQDADPLLEEEALVGADLQVCEV